MSDRPDDPRQPPHDATTRARPDAAPAPSVRIGPFRLLQRIGVGGMGEVWEAEQEAPVRRRVALKLIKPGMDTEAVVARFESERQALALMNHPNIARVYDAGATDQGRPYFVMELVPGRPITDYCDGARLSNHERIALFRQVCDGVQHAHQKGIIHRDLKPSNVLVTVQDDRPVPKIIDFGVAKATDRRLTERTLFTQVGQLLGTPEYMSPEQADPVGVDIDTRTDVYSLGVLLYQLLVGSLPFDAAQLRRAGLEEMLRRIREEDPPRPSTRVTTLGEASSAAARSRRAEPATLFRQLRGDLDWIVMHALEKDRTRRYPSASELAADLERFLHDEPVLARPPTTAYRVRKFIRRNTVGVIAASLVAAALLLGVVGTTVGLLRARSAEREARRQGQTARQISGFLVDLFEVADPTSDTGNTITARELLDDAERRIREDLADEPVVQARLMRVIGTVYNNLGLYAVARPLLEESLAIVERQLGPHDLTVADTLHELGALYWQLGDYTRAQTVLQRALAIREAALGPDDATVADTLGSLAAVADEFGDYAAARALYLRALGILERTEGPSSPALAGHLANLGLNHWFLAEYDEARRCYTRALAIEEAAYGPAHPYVAVDLNSLAALEQRLGRFEIAQPLFERSLEIRLATRPDQVDVAYSLEGLAGQAFLTGRYEEARRQIERARQIRETALDPEHVTLGWTLTTAGAVDWSLGRRDRARAALDRALRIGEASGRNGMMLANTLSWYGRLLAADGELERGRAMLERGREIRIERFGVDHPDTAEVSAQLAAVLIRSGEAERGEQLLKVSLATQRKFLGPRHPETGRTLGFLAELARLRGDAAEAARLSDEAEAIRRSYFVGS